MDLAITVVISAVSAWVRRRALLLQHMVSVGLAAMAHS